MRDTGSREEIVASNPLSAVLPATPRRFRPYPKYKDSGVEGLGDIPAHWQVKRLKTIAHVQLSNVDKKSVDGDVPVRLCNYVDVYYNDYITSSIEFMSATATPEQRTRFSLRRGDVLITKDSESWTDIAVPAVVAEDFDDVVCGYHLAHIRPLAQLDGRFLARAFSAVGPRDQFQIAANGITRFGLSRDAIKDALFAVPPLPEQVAIAAFLDRETTKVDALVAKKARVIELLQEKRIALITQAVTKGLDLSAPMKDSGIEWLGEIPVHWDISAAGRLIAGIEQGWSPVAEDRVAGPEEWGVIKLSAVSKGRFISEEHKALPVDVSPDVRYRICDGDFLLTRANTPDLVGDVCVVRGSRENVMLCDLVYRLRLQHDRVEPAFLAYWLLSRSGRHQIEVDARGSSQSMVKISQGHIRRWRVVLPPYDEQVRIAAHLDAATSKLDDLLTTVGQGIDRLKEFRAALIAAAVTGKIDVREGAA